MEKREAENKTVPTDSEHPGTQPLAQNPNPRANENIRNKTEEKENESADMEDEVGFEITDGEDA